MESIEEYHICEECRYHIQVPSSINFDKWEVACTKKRNEINRSGGLTRCPIWKEGIRL